MMETIMKLGGPDETSDLEEESSGDTERLKRSLSVLQHVQQKLHQ